MIGIGGHWRSVTQRGAARRRGCPWMSDFWRSPKTYSVGGGIRNLRLFLNTPYRAREHDGGLFPGLSERPKRKSLLLNPRSNGRRGGRKKGRGVTQRGGASVKGAGRQSKAISVTSPGACFEEQKEKICNLIEVPMGAKVDEERGGAALKGRGGAKGAGRQTPAPRCHLFRSLLGRQKINDFLFNSRSNGCRGGRRKGPGGSTRRRVCQWMSDFWRSP